MNVVHWVHSSTVHRLWITCISCEMPADMTLDVKMGHGVDRAAAGGLLNANCFSEARTLTMTEGGARDAEVVLMAIAKSLQDELPVCFRLYEAGAIFNVLHKPVEIPAATDKTQRNNG